MTINTENFGTTPKGEKVTLYIIENSKMKIEIINLGCTIKSIYTPNKRGVMENIVLGFKSLNEYLNDTSYLGCIVGRIAGRIKYGVLEINDDIYQLSKNNGPNNLHGGVNGIHKKVWDCNYEVVKDRVILTFTVESPHMEEGFPGDVSFTVKYIIHNESLTIEYTGIPNMNTYMNLTNHVYFNLNADFNKTIDNHEVFINSNGYFSVDHETLPVEFIKNDKLFIEKRPFLLETAFASGHEQIEIVGNGFDHAFQLNKTTLTDGYVEDSFSGRRIEFTTDQPVVVFYTGNNLIGTNGFKKHTGFCLETQDYPDIKNIMPDKMKIYNKSNHYTQTTIYNFY